MFHRKAKIILLYLVSSTSTVLGSECECDNSNSISHPGCGIIPITPTIINGSAASYPWMVFLYNFGDTKDSFCGGILISDIQIMTAAHCMIGRTIEDVVVVVGTDNVDSELRKLNYRILYKIEIYPYYFKTMEMAFKHSSDVALITLEKPLVINSKITPICLPDLDKSEETYEGKTATVAGWGVTENGETSMKQLMHVKVPIISNAECKTFYSWTKRYMNMNV